MPPPIFFLGEVRSFIHVDDFFRPLRDALIANRISLPANLERFSLINRMTKLVNERHRVKLREISKNFEKLSLVFQASGS
jgi:hypothetical protein